MGMIVSEICTPKRIVVGKPIFYASVGAAVFLLVALDKVLQLELLGEKRTILYGAASSLIIFGLVQLEDTGRVVCGNKAMQLLGDSSYALYLIHYPLISSLCKLSLLFQLNKFGVTGALIAYLFIFFACIMSSVAFHLWVEKPITAYIRNRCMKI